MRERLEVLIANVLADYADKLGIPQEHVNFTGTEIEVPKQETHGDLSLNIAFRLAKQLKRPPLKIAEDLKQALSNYLTDHPEMGASFIEKINVASPGFVNFFFSQTAMTEALRRIAREGAAFGQTDFGKGSRVLLEFVSANPTGPLTIAHGRQACLGDTLAAIMKKCGFDVVKEFYLNDGGKQIATLGKSVWLRLKESHGEAIDFPEDAYQGDYIRDLALALKAREGDALLKLSEQDAIRRCATYAAEEILEGIRRDLAAISVSFDSYYSEATLYEGKVEKTLIALEKSGLLYESEGALWFASTRFGDDKDRVLRKSDGSFTYLVPDIAYHHEKFQRGFNRVVDFFGPDHHGYLARLKAAMQALGHDPAQLDVLIVQLTTLYKEGVPFRMSTRKGNFITLRELIDEVGPDAARLFFLMKLISSPLDFDLSLAKQTSQDNPVYYFQYAYVRILSILRLSEIKDFGDANLDCLKENEEAILIKKMADYPYLLIAAAKNLEPFRLVGYLQELAALFHQFYNRHRVISPDLELTKARLFLVSCIQIVISNGLRVLGVTLPERM